MSSFGQECESLDWSHSELGVLNHSSGRSPLVIGDQEPENYQSLNFDLFKSFEMRVDFSKIQGANGCSFNPRFDL